MIGFCLLIRILNFSSELCDVLSCFQFWRARFWMALRLFPCARVSSSLVTSKLESWASYCTYFLCVLVVFMHLPKIRVQEQWFWGTFASEVIYNFIFVLILGWNTCTDDLIILRAFSHSLLLGEEKVIPSHTRHLWIITCFMIIKLGWCQVGY